ncbi:hypothetical protein B566_EDAN014965 [Ephemera danica]|nr:hypothetical protein B566_EDAN014965 [Ephemera danica]
MECEVKKQRTHQRNRRRERAQRMQAQRESKAASGQIAGDSGEDESPVREKPPRPPNRRKKLKEPLYEEDIIDGFAILAFKSYEDLENAVKKHSEKHHAARHNNNVHLAAATQARASSKPAKLHQDTKQPPGPSPPPPRLHHLHVLHNGAPPPANDLG